MFDFLKIFGKEKASANVAKDRLQLVLVHDRATTSPEFIQKVKQEILDALAGHMEFDHDELDIKIEQTEKDGKPALIANIPIKKMDRS